MPQKWNADAFEVRPSTISNAGNGLFALVHISLEDTIGYYTGKVLDNKAFHDPKRPASDYILYLCNNHIILGEGPLANYTRYINHSSRKPNVFLITSTRWKTARFEAIKSISPGDEISLITETIGKISVFNLLFNFPNRFFFMKLLFLFWGCKKKACKSVFIN